MVVSKDKKQDKEIERLKKELKSLSKKYLKKRRKEVKEKGKYNNPQDIQSLINLLQRGVGGTPRPSMGGIPTMQPVIQQTPATMGTIASRISTGSKKKTEPQDPIKLWRELKSNWSSIKDKYNNDTITRQDLVNLYNKAKSLASAVKDDSLLLVSEIVAMYGIGKAAYEYFMRFINKNRPSTENRVSLTDATGPTPPPTDPSPPPPPTPPPTEVMDWGDLLMHQVEMWVKQILKVGLIIYHNH